MGNWEIVVAEATTNLITNPSFETGTTGWAAYGGSAIALAVDPVYGLYCMYVQPSATITDGVLTTVSATATVTYTFSAYVKGAVSIPYHIFMTNAGGTNVSTPTVFIGDGEWHRYSNIYTAPATEELYLVIAKQDNASVALFYIDAAQCEAKAYSTTYCDGSIDPPTGFPSSGCSWNGVAHASTSTRSVTSRAGGRLYDLEDTYHLKPLQIIGAGAPPVENYSTPYALIDGSLFEHSRIAERMFAINGLMVATTQALFMAYHGALYAVLKPKPYSVDEPVRIRYTGAARTLEISAYYAGGLEGGMMYALTEQIQLRFLATAPNWLEVIV